MECCLHGCRLEVRCQIGGGRHPGAVIVPARILVQHVVDQQNTHMRTANCQNGGNGLLLRPANRLTGARRDQPVIRPSRGGSLEQFLRFRPGVGMRQKCKVSDNLKEQIHNNSLNS